MSEQEKDLQSLERQLIRRRLKVKRENNNYPPFTLVVSVNFRLRRKNLHFGKGRLKLSAGDWSNAKEKKLKGIE
jgi:hypothetical protein